MESTENHTQTLLTAAQPISARYTPSESEEKSIDVLAENNEHHPHTSFLHHTPNENHDAHESIIKHGNLENNHQPQQYPMLDDDEFSESSLLQSAHNKALQHQEEHQIDSNQHNASLSSRHTNIGDNQQDNQVAFDSNQITKNRHNNTVHGETMQDTEPADDVEVDMIDREDALHGTTNTNSHSQSSSRSVSVQILGDNNANNADSSSIANQCKTSEMNETQQACSTLLRQTDAIDDDNCSPFRHRTDELEASSNTDSGIGTQPENAEQDNKQHEHSKQEMDVDEQEPTEPAEEIIHEVAVKRKPKRKQPSLDEEHEHVQKTDVTQTENNDYNEEEDEDFNEEEEEEEEEEEDEEEDDDEEDDEEGDGEADQEIILGEDEEDAFHEVMSDLADIDIVDDRKIYTEEAPRWLISVAEHGDEINVEEWYQDWELDKQRNGTIYSGVDESDEDDEATNGDQNAQMAGDFFASLLRKYNTKIREDPEKDKIKKQTKNEYKLDDTFIDDDDCFEQNGVETVHPGFFIAKGSVDVKKKRTPSKSSKASKKRKYQRPLPDIPEAYHEDLQRVRDAVAANREVIEIIAKHRNMPGITINPELYWKFGEEAAKSEHEEKLPAEVVDTYRTLLTMLLEFDLTLHRAENQKNSVIQAVYKEICSLFLYDTDGSPRKIQDNFEKLLDWFTFDWFDEEEDDEAANSRRSNKMCWRAIYLDVMKKRAKARFNNKLNKVRKEKTENGKESNHKKKEIKFPPEDIPWDQISPEIFLMTVYSMEIAALNDKDMDSGAHECQTTLHQSLGKYIQGGDTMVKMKDIETKYNEYLKDPTKEKSNFTYSWLIVQRIKEAKRTKKRKKPKSSSRKTKKASSNSSTTKKSADKSSIELTSKNGTLSLSKKKKTERSVKTEKSAKERSPSIRQMLRETQQQTGDKHSAIDLTENSSSQHTASSSVSAMTNTRKRKYREMSASFDDAATQESSPMIKRQRVMSNDENRENNHSNTTTNGHTEDNVRSSPKVSIVQKYGTIGVQPSASLRDGVELVRITECVGDCITQTMSYRNHQITDHQYKDNRYCFAIQTFNAQHRKRFFHRYVTPQLQQELNLDENSVLALTMDSHGNYDWKYRLAQIVDSQDKDEAVFGVRYAHCPEQGPFSIPLYCSSPSADGVNFVQIPTIIHIVPLKLYQQDLHGAFVSAEKYEQRSRRQPPFNNMFYAQFPIDPWSDIHFQGGRH